MSPFVIRAQHRVPLPPGGPPSVAQILRRLREALAERHGKTQARRHVDSLVFRASGERRWGRGPLAWVWEGQIAVAVEGGEARFRYAPSLVPIAPLWAAGWAVGFGELVRAGTGGWLGRPVCYVVGVASAVAPIVHGRRRAREAMPALLREACAPAATGDA